MKQIIDIIIHFLQFLINLNVKSKPEVEKKSKEVPKKEPELPKDIPEDAKEEPVKEVYLPVEELEHSQQALDLIKKWEGFRASPYLCSAKVPTIGYGSTYYEDGTKVTLADAKMSMTRAEKLLKKHIEQYENSIKSVVKVELTQNQFDALVSFVYNIGSKAFKESTLLNRINKKDYKGAAAQFDRWNKVAGKPVEGLTKRRLDERALFERKV